MNNLKINILQFLGISSLTFYVIWNTIYISKKVIPPSILYNLTGVPSPTTGMFRSLKGLINLDSNAFLGNNPVVILFLLALLVVGIELTYKLYKKEKIVLNKKSSYFLFICLIFGELVSIKNYLL